MVNSQNDYYQREKKIVSPTDTGLERSSDPLIKEFPLHSIVHTDDMNEGKDMTKKESRKMIHHQSLLKSLNF